MQIAPIGDPEFTALMARVGPFGFGRRIVVGVSGGADSLSLALLLKRWGDPFAVVIDHGLRNAARMEADLTVKRLAEMGVASTLIRLELSKGPGLGARARDARYGALLQVCRDRGCPDLLVGHHAQDQAETTLLRAASGSGRAGLAGMAPTTWLGDARLLRPLLSIDPARLRATLRAAGVDWVEDPTNADRSTPRGALRLDRGRFGPALREAAMAGRARAGMEGALAGELAGAVSLYPTGHAEVRGGLSDAAWSALLWTVSGRRYPPPRAGISRLASSKVGTLHGVQVCGGLVAREAAAMSAPIRAGDGVVWDGRFAIDGPGLGAASLGALGDDAAQFRRSSDLPAVVLRTLPAIRAGKKLLIVPHLDFPDARTSRSVVLSFRPGRPLAGAPFEAGVAADDVGDAQTA